MLVAIKKRSKLGLKTCREPEALELLSQEKEMCNKYDCLGFGKGTSSGASSLPVLCPELS